MGSRKSDGSRIVQEDFRAIHKGSEIELSSLTGVDTTVQLADNSIEFSKFTSSSGNLEHEVTRGMGIHTSISSREAVASGSLGSMETVRERKVFFTKLDRNSSSPAAWTIYSASGIPVGDSDGISDIDNSPAATFDE